MKLLGRSGTGHGGGLRGWRSLRFYLPAERISIVVMFNHSADVHAAAIDLLSTLIEAPKPEPVQPAAVAWDGSFQEPETGLVVRLQTKPDHRIGLHYGQSGETLDPTPDGAIAGKTHLRRTEDGIWMDRGGDNQSTLLQPVQGEASMDVTGRFHSAEYDADFNCLDSGGTLYGVFSGFLGESALNIMLPVATDLWRLPMPRALDQAPPGDWTLHFQRDASGVVSGVEIGCWLARRVMFVRV